MGTEIVATAQVSSVSGLMYQLENLQFGESSYYLLQRPDSITDWKKGCPDVAEIEEYMFGRMFGRKGEIRWQKTEDGYMLLWLSEGDLPEDFESFGTWEMCESQNVFLLGGGETSPWRDARIPRTLDYPMDWSKYLKVKVVQYKDLISQTIRFTRYTDFVS